MESVLERINKNHFWKFFGGIHPPQQKFLTNDKPIKVLPLPSELIIPLKQHIGSAAELLVEVGDFVLKGQALTGSDKPMMVPIHAPTSGTVTALGMTTSAHPSGMKEPCLVLKPDGNDTWRTRHITENFRSLTKSQLVEKIANAGIAGMGGAGFPTSIKVDTNSGLNFLIINAVECEPYISADDLLMREHSAAIIDGVEILDFMLEPALILIGIEDNKPQAIAALKAACKNHDNIKICVLPTKYPTGGEKQLIKALTGQEVPSGVLPVSLGMVVQNIATVFAIGEAIINDIPLLRRVVTVTGQAIAKPQNVWSLLGTPVAHLLNCCGFNKTPQQRVIMGGPLMGFTLSTLQVPVVKTTNCILAPTTAEISPASKEVECIRCGQCAEVCPSQLLPQELQWHAKAKNYPQLEKLNLADCIECGACAYVCPSQIPLVQYYRVAKAELRANKEQELKADKAKLRFEARNLRLEKDKLAREAKHQQAIAARKSAASTTSGQASNSAVAAALARVKAKKAQQSAPSSVNLDVDVKTRAAAAIDRAKAKKLAQANTDQSAQATEAKKASATNITTTSTSEVPSTSAAEIKKAKTVAAVAKAKAKKLAKSAETKATGLDAVEINNDAIELEKAPEATDENVLSAAEAKKLKLASAVAKAKAKQKQQVTSSTTPSTITDADKKQKIAAAIKKAKAKKLNSQAAAEKNKQESD